MLFFRPRIGELRTEHQDEQKLQNRESELRIRNRKGLALINSRLLQPPGLAHSKTWRTRASKTAKRVEVCKRLYFRLAMPLR